MTRTSHTTHGRLLRESNTAVGKKALRVVMMAALAASCSSTTSTTPSTITPATFVMTWPNLIFPTTGIGTTSPTSIAVTLSNNGTAAVPVTSAVSANAAEFPITTTCQLGGSLAPSSTCNVTARFKPTAVGARSGTLTIVANGKSQDFAITGTGATISPQLTIAPAGNVAPNVVTLSGTGMTPSSNVELHTVYTASGAAPTNLPTTTWVTDASGNVTAAFTPSTPGTYEQSFLDLTSGVSTNHVVYSFP
jgi:Abnormal spindle-like microcephaly-assoc'd, ASPM-SPD-2-Hydin